ncbi:hypothetical protein Neosp_014645 [[Neocosmospora] mangrovei]
MADSGLLRFLGANKSRAHGLSSPRSEPALKDLANMNQRDTDVQAPPERPSMTRMASWQGLASAEQATPSASVPEPPVVEPDDVDKLFINASQQVWHNPNIHHKIAKLERDLENTKDVLEKQSQRHDSIEEHWMVQEARYKAEVKRLELVIHEVSGKGLQAVALARAGSLIRNKPRALSEGVAPGGDAADDYSPGSNISNEVRLSRRFRRLDKIALKKRAEGTCRVDEESANHGETYDEQGRAEQQPFRRETGSPSGTSSSGVGDEPPQEGKAKKKRHSAERRASHGAGIDGQPKAATQTSQNDKAAVREPRNDDQQARGHRRQFSFVPGDDGAAVRLAGTMASRNTAVAQENPEQIAALDDQPRPPLSTKPEVEIGRVDKGRRSPTAGY